jgi:hypothetical protein
MTNRSATKSVTRRAATLGGLAVLLALLALQPLPALAWNAAGHRLAAVIAWREMSPPVRKEALQLLRLHPAVAEWQARLDKAGASDDDDLLLFAEASTWADDLRRRSVDLAPFGHAARVPTADWHYLNWPLGEPRTAPHKGQLDRQIARQSLAVADRTLPRQERAEALAWLLHLIADAHQPLHVATRRADPAAASRSESHGDDAGGNGLAVFDAANPRMAETNLHRFWDDLPGAPWLRGKRLLGRADELAKRHPADAVPLGDVELWLGESHRFAATAAYPTSTATPLTVDDAYRTRARALAEQRVAAAGARLGRWLDLLLRR